MYGTQPLINLFAWVEMEWFEILKYQYTADI